MKQIYTLIYIAMALLLGSCTHNDGDIGDLFGTWRLDVIRTSAYDEDGQGQMFSSEEVTDVFWCFQSNVIMMERVADHHDVVKRYGSWSRQKGGSEWGDMLTLNFTHSDNDHPSGTMFYDVLEGIYLPGGEMKLVIRSLDKDIMVLSYHDDSQRYVYTYYFTKW